MALLDELRRLDAWAAFQREESQSRVPMGLLKADLRAAVDAVDEWVNDNAALFNAAIPLPARTSLTARQKAKLLMVVVERRFKVVA